jgi:Holliday junction resolvase RusA-like endonuclease
MMEFIIEEPIFPYVRMTQRSKWIDPAATAYLRNKGVLKWILQNQMDAGDFLMLKHAPMGCDLSFNVQQLHKCDLDNLVKAVLDAAQGIVYANDCWIDLLAARRRIASTPRLVFSIWELK